ncbi:RNA polymerase sigma factor [Blastopirellula marina]|nr:sigma factor [Blastopirellula marina]
MAHFPTTAWNIIDSLKGGQLASLDSRNCFVQSYWPAVFAYLRRRGFQQSNAEDLTQDFFCYLFEKELVGSYQAERGRFRTYILTLLTRFVSDRTTSRAPRQRRFENDLVPISCLAATHDIQLISGESSPEQEFMRQWARSVIQSTRNELRLWCQAQGRPDWYLVFDALNPPDLSSASRKEAIAQSLRLTIDQVRYAQTKSEQKFIELLRLVVLEQVESENEVDDEIRSLRRLL